MRLEVGLLHAHSQPSVGDSDGRELFLSIYFDSPARSPRCHNDTMWRIQMTAGLASPPHHPL